MTLKNLFETRVSFADENIRFLSGKENKEFFDIGVPGQAALYKILRETSSGTLVFFNLDMLNPLDEQGKENPYSVAEATGVLTDLFVLEFFRKRNSDPDYISSQFSYNFERFLTQNLRVVDLKNLGRH